MNLKDLGKKLREHLLNTVGEKPSEEEMKLAEEQIKKGYGELYDSPNKDELLISRVYDRISNAWKKVVANENHLPELILFQKYAEVKSDFKITSFASGLAVYELFLAKEFVPNGFVTCIDVSETMNKIARQFIEKLHLKNIEIITGSVLKTPIESNSQDIVLARRTGLSKDNRWVNVLKEAHRILKKQNTSIFIYTVDKVFNDSLEEIKNNLSKADFNFVAMEEQYESNEGIVSMIIAKPKI
ncbi:hypothetical protein COU60_01370 [Candidatus Pacearchaeota archaeon CG10_big_fil_rev_8_21_14_0_10_34_76]|nr:MAG: hypothetical protein COU60_01370 [Candidatus Pacearchaeota archaeon CG10_big_fil_rev_8_21_14_0_10_34_76]